MSTTTTRRHRGLAAGGLAAGILALGLVVPSPPAADALVARGATSTSITVDAPGAGTSAKVTVSKTTHLVNQTVAVSWDGFRPSSSTILDNSGDAIDVNTQFPVRVYQCRGKDPASSSECYGSSGFRGIPASGDQPAVPAVPAFTYPGQDDPYNSTPDGPPNWQDTVTAPDGSGEVAIQLFTRRESVALGCTDAAPCSVVVVPNYGRPDTGARATELDMDAPWAWARRTVVPLDFLPTNDACPLTGDAVKVEGSPMAARALASWRARTCVLDQDPVRLDYTAIGEPQTREDVATGTTTDVGLVIDPLDPATADKGLVYAPVAATSLVVAFQVDDKQGKPVRSMNLDARLVAKLVTASYRQGGNAAVAGNPVNIFRDPEFLQLNPGTDWPSGAPGNHPLLLGDLSDTTLALTRWLKSDKDARAFLAGTADPWGMKVNANYKGVQLPFANFPLLDPKQSDNFEPVQELDALARKVSIAQFPGAISSVEGGVTVVTKPPRQNPGRREVIGIIDAASAHDFRLSTAALRNTGGAYVGPSDDAVLAGLRHAVVGKDGVTRAVDLTSTDRAVYPLALLVGAASSARADKTTRDAMSTFLDYVASAGQVPGDEVGKLPAGYVPLPQSLVDLVRVAQKKLAAGYTDPPAESPATPASPKTVLGGSGTSDLPVGAAPAGDPAATARAAVPAPASASSPVALVAQTVTIRPSEPGDRLLALPLLLLLGVVALLAGPIVLLLQRTGRTPAWLRR